MLAAEADPVIGCPHGDPTCPCQDGTAFACHYEGADAFWCLTMPDAEPGHHCHGEGCRWLEEGCGLSRLGIAVPTVWPVTERSDPLRWVCGATRFVEARWEDFWTAAP